MTEEDSTPPDDRQLDSPSGVWFAIESGRQSGPWSLEALLDRTAVGLLDQGSPVWTDGMSDWMPLGEVFAADRSLKIRLVAEGRTLPPGAEGEVIAADPSIPGAPMAGGPIATGEQKPWHRWLARILDLWCTSIIYGIVLVVVNGQPPGGQIVESVVMLLLQVPLETAYQATFGTTPGKWLMRINVRDAEGRRLSWSLSFWRAVQVWLFGMCAGVPIAVLLTMHLQYTALRRTGHTTYDARRGFVVTYGELSRARVATLVTIVVIVVSLAAVGLSAMARQQGTP